MKLTKHAYLIGKALRALLWLIAFVVLYILYKRYVHIDYLDHLEPLFNSYILIFAIFLVSEVIVGIIPPELFIIWALRTGRIWEFSGLVLLLSVISYGSGILGYFIGSSLSSSVYYRFLKRRFLRKLDKRVQEYGVYLIIVAALTPLPFSGVSMLIGSVRFSFRRFALFALTRFIRFLVYALIFWYIEPTI